MKKVGIMVGRERSFPLAFMERVNARSAGVTAEWVKLGGTSLSGPNPYAVIVDRISHEVPYYQIFLKYAQLQGTYVINNPFARMIEDKFTANLIAQQQGVAVPKSLILPNKAYIPDITSDSLSNLIHPLDWQEIADYIGFPAVLKPAVGGGWKSVSIVHSVEEMIRAYDASGQLSLIIQEFIAWDRYLRCICIGRQKVMPIAWDPNRSFHERYLRDPNYLSSELGQRVVEDALKLCQGLGHDMNTVEFAIRDSVPIAIDFTNSAPDFDIVSLGEWHFNWVLDAMTDLVIEKAHASPITSSSYVEGFASSH
jgi:glutathione synthase/RimK-type ligase-like ATP-grasp enzyme